MKGSYAYFKQKRSGQGILKRKFLKVGSVEQLLKSLNNFQSEKIFLVLHTRSALYREFLPHT